MRFSKKGYNWGDGNFLLEMGGGEVRNGEWGGGWGDGFKMRGFKEFR